MILYRRFSPLIYLKCFVPGLQLHRLPKKTCTWSRHQPYRGWRRSLIGDGFSSSHSPPNCILIRRIFIFKDTQILYIKKLSSVCSSLLTSWKYNKVNVLIAQSSLLFTTCCYSWFFSLLLFDQLIPGRTPGVMLRNYLVSEVMSSAIEIEDPSILTTNIILHNRGNLGKKKIESSHLILICLFLYSIWKDLWVRNVATVLWSTKYIGTFNIHNNNSLFYKGCEALWDSFIYHVVNSFLNLLLNMESYSCL